MDRYGKLDKIEAALPSTHYFDPALYEREMGVFFHNRWVCVGRSSEVPDPGDYVAVDVAGRGVFITRDRQQVLHAFYNTCRHRGTALCSAQRGAFDGVIVCPYHAWTYGLDGELLATPNILPAENFDKAGFGLYEVALEEWEGFLYAHLGPNPTGLLSDPSFGRAGDLFKNYQTGELQVAARIEYDVECNWKLIVENFSECYHCPGVHPEWCETMPRMKRGGAIPFVPEEYDRAAHPGGSAMAEGFETMTWSGRTNRPQFEALSGIERKIISGHLIWPNLLLSYHPDYVHTQRIVPTGPKATHMVYEWLFDAETMAMPDFDPTDTVELWDVVNQQDFGVCILAQRGLTNPAHANSVYAPQERGLHAFNQYIQEGLESG